MGAQGETRRRMLLDAALERFAREGYDRTTTREIAEATGVTEAVLFKHFATKRDLFLAVLEEYAPPDGLPSATECFGELPADAALAAALRTYLNLWWQHRHYARLLRQELERDHEARERMRQMFLTMRTDLRALLDRLAARGEIRANAAALTTALLGIALRGFIATAMHRANDGEERPRWNQMREWFVRGIVDTTLHGIASREDRADE